MAFFKFLVGIVGTLMSFGYFPQAYQIYKNKSAKDVSLFTYSIFAFGTTVWTIYGLVLGDMTIVSGFIVGVIGSWSVLILKLIYK